MSERESFSLQKVIQVRYRNESGVDVGGLKRVFSLYPHGPVARQQLANAIYRQRGILTQCKRTGTATRPVYSDWDTHPVRTYWHCNKASTQRLGYSPSANVLALQQGQYTTIGILTQCERTGTTTRTVHNVGYSPSANVLALQQGQYTTWDTHPVQKYWHCNKASTQRGILTQCERTGTATTPVHSDRPHGGGNAAPRSGHATHLQPPVYTILPVRMQATGDTCGKPTPADNT